MKMTTDDAKELAKSFREISVSLGNYKFGNWSNLTEKDRSSIENMEWTLLNYSSDFITQAVGLLLDDATASLTNIQQATAKAKQAIAKIKTVKKVIVISTSVIELAAAIVTKNPVAIATALGNVAKTVKESNEEKDT